MAWMKTITATVPAGVIQIGVYPAVFFAYWDQKAKGVISSQLIAHP